MLQAWVLKLKIDLLPRACFALFRDAPTIIAPKMKGKILLIKAMFDPSFAFGRCTFFPRCFILKVFAVKHMRQEERQWLPINHRYDLNERFRACCLYKEDHMPAIFTSSIMATPELQVQLASVHVGTKVHPETSVYHNLLSFQEVQRVVERSLGSEVKVRKFSLAPYSDGKLGFLGSHQRLSVEARTKNGKETLSFFVKVIPYDVPKQAEYVADKCVFVKERLFHRRIIPQLYSEYNGEPWTSACHLVKENLLVFEDLGAMGYSMRNKLFTKELVVSGLTSIARLHASSLLAEARLGVSLKKMYPDAFVENAFCPTGMTRAWFDVGVNAIVAVAKQLGLDASLIPKACDEVYAAMDMSSTKRNVVSHGDLWGNNFMFSDDVPPKCLLVDFQLLRYSPLGHDVAQFLYLCTDREFRETWEGAMLEHYYNVLRETLSSAKSTSVDVPPWSELIQGMEEQRLAALITAATYYQTVLLDENLSAEIMNDPDKYSEYVFQSRVEIVLQNVKNDPEYGRRIMGAVTELVELSFRLDQLPKPT